MDVSPDGAGTIKMENNLTGNWYKSFTPSPYPYEGIVRFKNNDITLTANPAPGYQFDHWEFNLWPPDLNKASAQTMNPLRFENTDNDYPNEDFSRFITAHFTTDGSAPPQTSPTSPSDPNDPDAPSAPNNVSASDGAHADKITVSWSHSADPDHYEVYRAESADGWKTRIATITESSYDDESIAAGETYYYWIKAYNSYKGGPLSGYDSGYAGASGGDGDSDNDNDDPSQQPQQPGAETGAITPADAKEMLDTNRDVIVVDVSKTADFEAGHLICARNASWNGMFEFLDYQAIGLDNYRGWSILVYDQTARNSRAAADYLTDEGFSSVYHMTGGLAQWIANGWETIASEDNCETCSLPPIALAGTDQTVVANETVYLDGSGSRASDGGELSYEWHQYAGSEVDIVNAASKQARFTAPEVAEGGETLYFHLTVSDSQNKQDTDSVAIHVQKGSLRPAGSLYFPHIASNTEWETELGIINKSSQPLSVTLAAYDDKGGQLSGKPLDLSANGRRSLIIGDAFENPEEIAYITAPLDSADICGYARFSREGHFAAAVPAVQAINTGDIYVPHIASNNNWQTSLYLLNTTDSDKTLDIRFNKAKTRQIDIAAGERKGLTIRSLFDGEFQPDLESAVISEGDGVIGMALFSGEKTLGAVLLKGDAAETIYFPHLVSNHKWWTGIAAYNTGGADASLGVTPYANSGGPPESLNRDLPPGKKYFGNAGDLGLPGDTSWFKVDSSQSLNGFALLGSADGRMLAGYCAANLKHRQGVFAKLNPEGWTGLALVNTAETSAEVALTAYDDDGFKIAEETITLEAYGKMSQTPETIFGPSVSAATYITFSSDKELVGLQLNGSEDGSILDGLPGM